MRSLNNAETSSLEETQTEGLSAGGNVTVFNPADNRSAGRSTLDTETCLVEAAANVIWCQSFN